MPKIILTNSRTVEVSSEEAERIENEWKDPENKTIDLGDLRVRRIEIKAIDKEIARTGDRINQYDMHNERHKQIIRDFERELEKLKHQPLRNQIEYYGEPKPILPAFKMGSREFPESHDPRRVYNDITGLCDAGIVQFLLEIRAISRRYVKADKPGSYWAVGPDLGAYTDFENKKRALGELKEMRQIAEQNRQEAMDALIADRDQLSERMKI